MFHSDIITEIINLIGTKDKNDEIFAYSKNHYDLHQFNVASLYPKDVRKMNESLKRRYKHQEIQVLPANWNQGERRLFVWFMICFLYQKKVDIEQISEEDLVSLSKVFYGKDTIFLDFQLRNLPKITKSKRSWSTEEDELLKSAIKTLKVDLDESKLFNNWNEVAKIMFFQTERRIFRTPKACRQRWYNHLDESKKKDEFSVEEDLILINFILNESKSWSKIVKIMNYSRTEHRIKNRYYTIIRKYQKSFGNKEGEEMSEENERDILMKLKYFLGSKTDRFTNPIQMQDEMEELHFDGIKVEEQGSKAVQSEDKRSEKNRLCLNSQEILKVKNQINQVQFESAPKVKFLHEEEIELKNFNSSAELKEISNATVPFEEECLKIRSSYNTYWSESYMSYAQYIYHMNLASQQSFESSQGMSGPIIVNQFYCPIIFQKGIDNQFFQNQYSI